MKKELENKLIKDGWEFNILGDALDKNNTRIYTDDVDLYVLRFDNRAPACQWRHKLDGHMPVDGLKKIIDLMVSI